MGSEVTSKHLQGVTDLTLVADIKPGLAPSLDACTYETRLALVMRTFTGLRSSSREYAVIRPFSDTVERIQEIHSFRLAVIPPKEGEGVTRRLLLSVGFDGGWEQYIRRVWRDLGPLLDVMFCNTTDYKSAWDHSFQDYVAWIRSKQLDTGFFYSATGLSVTDLQYLRQVEKLHREGHANLELAAAQLTAADPEAVAKDAAALNPAEAMRLGLTALGTLYRLTDFYPPDHADGGYLWRATRQLMKELDTPGLPAPVRAAYATQIDWFEKPPPAPAPAPQPWPKFDPANVQAGILKGYDQGSGTDPRKKVNHGCLLLLQIADPDVANAHAFLRALQPMISRHDAPPQGEVYTNVAFTCQGLARLGVPAASLAAFPKEFQEGMADRADLLGDFRCNHPRNWALPKRNWPAPGGRVQLSTVDIVVQLRLRGRDLQPGDHEVAGNPGHPLYAAVEGLDKLAGRHGVRLLSVETMVSYRDANLDPVGHLDFVDGISQPMVPGIDPALDADDAKRVNWRDRVGLGEMLCGHPNDGGDAPLSGPAAEYLSDGTFLVVRKLRIDTDALDEFYEEQETKHGIPRRVLEGKMMGRAGDGTALAAPTKGNDFNYSSAANQSGALCPFQAHARRANPRTDPAGDPSKRVPRIMRRGMSYGPKGAGAADCGLMFLAYNASIAEQFEVIQRWIAGGNSTNVFAGDADPFLGVPQLGDPRTFRFHDGAAVTRVDLDAGSPHPGARPFSQVEWGAYLFVPSLAALGKLAAAAPQTPSDAVARGEQIIKTLLYLESLPGADIPRIRDAWKAYLEDLGSKEKGYNSAIWAALREKFGGALWTPYGVLVANPKMVDFVFTNKDLYSVEGHAGGAEPVEGYLHRSRDTIGEIYLGLDDTGPGSEYQRRSKETNEELMRLTGEEAFVLARDATVKHLKGLLALNGGKEVTLDLRTMLSDPVLAAVCRAWFDLPDGKYVVDGGWNWQSGHTPCCPGDFTSPSRYIFQPNPAKQVGDYAKAQGRALHEAVRQFAGAMKGKVSGKLSKALFRIIPDDDDRLASTLIGVMMGFLPTVDGNFRSTLLQWLADGTLWRLQADLRAAPGPIDFARAQSVLLGALKAGMQKRPVPDIVWRTAKVKHDLGPVAVHPGDKLAIGIVSSTQDKLAAGKLDVYPVFGGKRGPDGPTHACPAYEAGMGVLLGMVSGLLEAGTLRPTPVTLTVLLS
ncbi:MAG TPA: hypothetical protein VF110_11240 [Burkholderiales bacterium]